MVAEIREDVSSEPIAVASLEPGMYVVELDRPWLETPFSVQGFYILDRSDIEDLARYCRHVFIDPRRSERGKLTGAARLPLLDAPPRAGTATSWRHATASSGGSRAAPPPGPIHGRKRYRDSVGMREEFATAQRELSEVMHVVAGVFDRLHAGESLDLEAVTQAINPVIGSVLRNKDALAALIRVKKKDSYTYSHSISTAVWATILSRHLGLDRATVHTIGLSSMLLDIGKVNLPDELLAKRGELAAAERSLLRRHVEESLRILERSGVVDEQVLRIVAAHHERHDGSGYPRGLAGGDIPLGARIAGVADAYDAMITARPYAQARSSYEAMQELGRKRDIEFQGELVEQLIQAIGLFPTGSLVELDSGEVAIVIAQNASRRLKPKVVVVLDAAKEPLRELKSIDLLAAEQDASGGSRRQIARELPPGAYGIHAEHYYL